jgi:hypothetical protein
VKKSTPVKTIYSVLAAGVLLSGCSAVPIKPAITGYTCCNLAHSDGWVYSSNVIGGSFISAGQKATFDSIKKNRYVYGNINGRDIGLGNDTSKNKNDPGKGEADTLQWMQSLIVAENPRTKLATWPADIQKAVHYGKVIKGMTREQVLMALSYPSPTITSDLKDSTWLYQTKEDDLAVELVFGNDGKLASITGHEDAVRVIQMDNE